MGICYLAVSCAPAAYKKYISSYYASSTERVPDYSSSWYWAARPDKWNPSDSVPKPLRGQGVKDTSVDVFFIHPTTYGHRRDTAWNADINDPETNAKTDYTTILFQASAFNQFRVFAPRYRQAHVRVYYTTDTLRARQALDTAYQDVRSAFLYYLDHYNQGRPIIIASHSQGTTHAKRLLAEFFDGKPLGSKLVAAYLLGMPVSQNYFSHLTSCTDSLQTGCVISWRTFKKGHESKFVREETFHAMVTNPLTWKCDSTYAPKLLSRGAVLRDFNQVLPNEVDAQVHENVLWIHKPHFKGSFFYRSSNYHIGDINLFYVDIRENLQRRNQMFKTGQAKGSR